jgi:hypothetical protein
LGVDTRNLKEWFDSKQNFKELEENRNIEAGTIMALKNFEGWMRQQRYSANSINNTKDYTLP